MSDIDEFRVPPDLTAQPVVCPNCQSSNRDSRPPFSPGPRPVRNRHRVGGRLWGDCPVAGGRT